MNFYFTEMEKMHMPFSGNVQRRRPRQLQLRLDQARRQGVVLRRPQARRSDPHLPGRKGIGIKCIHNPFRILGLIDKVLTSDLTLFLTNLIC